MEYLSFTDTRRQLRMMLDSAEAGMPIGVQRHGSQVALIDSGRLKEVLLGSRRLGQPEAVAEAGGWSVLLPGTPIAADGADLDEALDEFVSALREYAEDWVARLRFAPNHGHHWPLVQFVSLSSDAEIAEWARGSRR